MVFIRFFKSLQKCWYFTYSYILKAFLQQTRAEKIRQKFKIGFEITTWLVSSNSKFHMPYEEFVTTFIMLNHKTRKGYYQFSPENLELYN